MEAGSGGAPAFGSSSTRARVATSRQRDARRPSSNVVITAGTECDSPRSRATTVSSASRHTTTSAPMSISRSPSRSAPSTRATTSRSGPSSMACSMIPPRMPVQSTRTTLTGRVWNSRSASWLTALAPRSDWVCSAHACGERPAMNPGVEFGSRGRPELDPGGTACGAKSSRRVVRGAGSALVCWLNGRRAGVTRQPRCDPRRRVWSAGCGRGLDRAELKVERAGDLLVGHLGLEQVQDLALTPGQLKGPVWHQMGGRVGHARCGGPAGRCWASKLAPILPEHTASPRTTARSTSASSASVASREAYPCTPASAQATTVGASSGAPRATTLSPGRAASRAAGRPDTAEHGHVEDGDVALAPPRGHHRWRTAGRGHGTMHIWHGSKGFGNSIAVEPDLGDDQNPHASPFGRRLMCCRLARPCCTTFTWPCAIPVTARPISIPWPLG